MCNVFANEKKIERFYMLIEFKIEAKSCAQEFSYVNDEPIGGEKKRNEEKKHQLEILIKLLINIKYQLAESKSKSN